MMREVHVAERLDAYRTGELDEAGRAGVEAHLEDCERCRERLAELVAWTSAIERGYEARRAGAASLAPDWAAQRAAIVARTSGRARSAAGKGAFWRWAPQIALVAFAVLIVGIVRLENPPETAESSRPADTGRADLGQGSEGEDALGRAASPASSEERVGQQNAPVIEKQARRDADESRDLPETLADRAAEPSREASLADVERFEHEARAALEARDTTAARQALALWSDTLAPRADAAAEPAAAVAARAAAPGGASLADSLRAFLEAAE